MGATETQQKFEYLAPIPYGAIYFTAICCRMKHPAVKCLIRMKKNELPRVEIGWREWISLPKLNIPAIKVKTDTGARTSAIHTYFIEPFDKNGRERVRFGVHPIQQRNDIEVICEADVVDQRWVTNTGGDREKRYVIETPMRVGSLEWLIKVTLASREKLNFRMLLGRTAMGKHVIIHPWRSYVTGKPRSEDAIEAAYLSKRIMEEE